MEQENTKGTQKVSVVLMLLFCALFESQLVAFREWAMPHSAMEAAGVEVVLVTASHCMVGRSPRVLFLLHQAHSLIFFFPAEAWLGG